MVCALLALISTASNAKYAMLGEHLLFSDFALLAALFRQPGFYFSALSGYQKWISILIGLALLGALAKLFVPDLGPHLVGLALMLATIVIMGMTLHSSAFAKLAPRPDAEADLRRHGLIASLLLYWQRWHETGDPPALPTPSGVKANEAATTPELIVVVQCESFADPVALTANVELTLPGLMRARAASCRWGDLNVSGFGAYTMRTEYGVLFGRSEAELGFRCYDPFLTARGEASYALSTRLGAIGYDCVFVHPHDLRFYGRDQLMPAIGFDRMVGADHFPPVPPGKGRYVGDRTVGAKLCDLIDAATQPTLLYAVTMENHGPWMKDRVPGSSGGLEAYLHHVRNSDAMLSDLMDHLANSGRTALLIFFGDHRPSIPGAIEPGPVRHTPYVMLRFAQDTQILSAEPTDLTPDALHHAILQMVD
ncbi:hypothetical protein QE358_003759 [Sphingomonas sp. SORGH_AS742]|nr:hypothetical protein [Sphingomonas sp. SORGH_AS_0742]